MSFAAGTLVRARGREWVVLPESEEDFLVLRPLGGTADETAGVHTALEAVEPATFHPPGPKDLGDFVSCRLLRDAMRFGFRSSAGPFRSFGRLNCQPRPYQLVPLLMALKLDPVRLLIADDVGIGKTVEACLVARELLDRGEIQRTCILCPPHLAEQWQGELRDKFNIDAELVISSTIHRLEKNLRADQSVFDVHPHVVVSLDFIKSDRRWHDFLRTCPEFVIVDEAHGCASGLDGRGASHQRHRLLTQLSKDADRHLVLVTATPHSGNEEAFRSLLALLKPEFADLPAELGGPQNAERRRHLASHLVQRRRVDLRHYLQRDTPFPEREDREDQYHLHEDYKRLFEKVLEYARDAVVDESGGEIRRRVRWWSALSLLRAMASSPAAAAATLRARSQTAEAADIEAADLIGRRAVLDPTEDQGEEGSDVVPGADTGESQEPEDPKRRKLLTFAREADALKGDKDAKLCRMADLVRDILKDGFRPILFCRFIETAEYVAAELRRRLPSKIDIICITSQLPAHERSARIESISDDGADQRVLVCTDCLSEGINLQEKFDAVVHYDLAWNPTRHEQRDGRVDRYGQKSPAVRILTYFSPETQIDGIVLDVLLRKHRRIRNDLGVSVAMPVDSEQIVEAIFEGLLLRSRTNRADSAQMEMFEEFFRPRREQVHEQWERLAEKDKRFRTVFAQESIKFEEVATELRETEAAIGAPAELAGFFRGALELSGATVGMNGVLAADLAGTTPALREALGGPAKLSLAFEPLNRHGVQVLHRTHPLVEGLASHVFNAALDPGIGGIARRAGVMRTADISARTVLFLLRLRFHIVTTVRRDERNLLAEDALLAAFTGPPSAPEWLPEDRVTALMVARPAGNVPSDIAVHALEQVTVCLPDLQPRFEALARERGEALLAAHRRVRTAARALGSYRIESNPPDIVGLYVFLPVANL